MAYLQRLKDIYTNKHTNRLEERLLDDCRLMIDDALNLDFEYIKEHIEENFEDEIYRADPFDRLNVIWVTVDISEPMIDSSDDVSEYFLHKRNNALFEKYLNTNNPEGNLTGYLEELPPFQKLKSDIEKELDGLEFDLGLDVTVDDKKLLKIEIHPSVAFRCDFNYHIEDTDEDE